MKKRIYLDYAATTPIDPRVLAAMGPYWRSNFGNPSSLHREGQRASAAVFHARRAIAELIGADYREVIFMGSATESNNIALRGITQKYTQNYAEIFRVDLREVRDGLRPRLIISAVEHESILETARDLERDGVEVIYLPVSREGIVDLKKLEAALNERTVLVSVMYANNEVGTIQPISKISELIRNFRNEISNLSRHNVGTPTSLLKGNKSASGQFLISKKLPNYPITQLPNRYPLLHTDAVQSFQYLDCSVNRLDVDLMTLSGHKIYGPKGVGALYVRNSKFQSPNSKQIPNSNSRNPKNWDLGFGIWDLPAVKPLVTGGGQEFGRRSGTENVPLIVGFAKAAEVAAALREKEARRVTALRDYFSSRLSKIFPAAARNGSERFCLPNYLNVYLPGHPSSDLLTALDLRGIAASAGSACAAHLAEPSRVIEAMGLGAKRARESVRFTLGRSTSKKDIDEPLVILRELLSK